MGMIRKRKILKVKCSRFELSRSDFKTRGLLRNLKQQKPVHCPEGCTDTKWQDILPEEMGSGRASAELKIGGFL